MVENQIPYRAEKAGLHEMQVEVRDAANTQFTMQQYPLCVPPGIEFRPGRRYPYPDEGAVNVRGEVLIRAKENQLNQENRNAETPANLLFTALYDLDRMF